MLGPNHFCWQAICSIPYHIASYGSRVTPQSFEDAEKIIEKILSNRHSIFQFKSNMQLGVRTGMVRSKFNCIAGINAFKQIFKKISSKNNASEVVNEWFVDVYTKEKFIKNLSTKDREKWMVTYKKNFTQSVKESLIEGKYQDKNSSIKIESLFIKTFYKAIQKFKLSKINIVFGIGKPVVDLVKYMENVHLRHCLPLNHASGLANLPVKYIYVDGKRTDNRTTRRFPITNTIIDGKKSYKDILAFFTTSDITPERVNEIGHERLNVLYPQVVEIAKNVTGLSNETAAITAFRKILANQTTYYNKKPFSEIESNATAHQRCTDIESARKFCPERYKSLKAWIASCRKVMSMLAPKIINLFYHTGEWITVPNCPIEMEPSFNPSAGAQFFRRTAKSCTTPAKFGLPFFLENHGPRFSEWSVTAHESWPGHHTQIQSHIEYFKDPYGGLPKWLDDRTYYTFFTEGWGLYSENPVIAEDTDTYEEEPMQKFGMLKWQVWRALRLIVDTGLHYRGMNRSKALWYFAHYAWDETDLARKEITRYQGSPGQATAYMLGQQKLVELRNYAKKQLNDTFKIQEFHYQVLSQGSAPEAYLNKHVKKFVQCKLGKLTGKTCDVILKPPKKSNSPQVVDDYESPQPPRTHYI
ncbi:uncharacterized protein LOC124451071 isoform X1 [Xenia sp. Carnegie-2017]|uniref:uncharacterized protein LOC124451071 isoform X1 n=1 Tax=Xenia sp. Carnegie-2017 TaxID=2897299 RepID=UPI001F04C377|nr:uncharacterized protein LOC124451071 isoform X1 [Xenia sp. Carnegie-2017]